MRNCNSRTLGATALALLLLGCGSTASIDQIEITVQPGDRPVTRELPTPPPTSTTTVPATTTTTTATTMTTTTAATTTTTVATTIVPSTTTTTTTTTTMPPVVLRPIPADLLFASRSSTLGPDAAQSLEPIAAFLADHPDECLDVIGHTDSRGTDADNDQLSDARADAVKTYLAAHGVDRDRITTAGRGETEPVATNETADGRQQNRRVEFVVAPCAP